MGAYHTIALKKHVCACCCAPDISCVVVISCRVGGTAVEQVHADVAQYPGRLHPRLRDTWNQMLPCTRLGGASVPSPPAQWSWRRRRLPAW